VAKTSLLNAWSGRSSLDSGVISVNGKPLTSSTMKRFQSKVAYVTQADVFFTHLTCPDGYNWADHWMDLLVRDGSGLDATSIDVGMRINESPS
jgi:ABC-type branched-subunit amino acid transport system ATPase component